MNRDKKLVSVLVPSYNHSKYICDCLDSIKNSNYTPLELIIIDDGSTDESPELIKKWTSANKKYFDRIVFIEQENIGVCKTLNKLIRLAAGDYCAFLASDDKIITDGITSRVVALENNSNWLAVYGDCKLIGDASQLLSSSAISYLYNANKLALINTCSIDKELILNWSVPGPGFMARKECFDLKNGVGLYNEEIFLEDRDYYLRLLAKKALGYIDVPVAEYRIHGFNSSRNESLIPRYAKALMESNARNINKFRGLSRLYLMVVTFNYAATIRFAEEKSFNSLFMKITSKILTVIVIRWHKLLMLTSGYRRFRRG